MGFIVRFSVEVNRKRLIKDFLGKNVLPVIILKDVKVKGQN